ncbi:hypothetical protein Athai_39260 [Actinocatenispora thailandica]|uniref:Uncharacterized protein n=2 Tax=Actinocatenispora thailandica TaxID=227318 RepID=A0A7R7HXW6_9ACTN|nr:hypothetical protein Athai_39260 [Actinocatenispora thailandica]
MVPALRAVGAVLVLLGLAHLALPYGMGWLREFTALTALTRRIMHLHTGFIGLACVLGGLPPLLLTGDLLAGGRLATAILAGECVFWGARWACQFAAFSPSIWRGSPVRTAGHVGFALLWSWITATFGIALLTATW